MATLSVLETRRQNEINRRFQEAIAELNRKVEPPNGKRMALVLYHYDQLTEDEKRLFELNKLTVQSFDRDEKNYIVKYGMVKD